MSLIETTLKKWDRAAIVRSRPRRLLNEQDSQSTLFFPSNVCRCVSIRALPHSVNKHCAISRYKPSTTT